MYKVVINRCYGGFSLSKELGDILIEKYGIGQQCRFGYWLPDDIERHDKRLISAIEDLGLDKSSGMCSKLSIETIHCAMYRIDEYDGMETLCTPDNQEWILIKGEV